MLVGRHIAQLRELHLGGNTIGPAGAYALTDALVHGAHLGTLRVLDIDINYIGDEGVYAVLYGLRHTARDTYRRIELRVGSNAISGDTCDAQRRAIKHIPGLEGVTVVW